MKAKGMGLFSRRRGDASPSPAEPRGGRGSGGPWRGADLFVRLERGDAVLHEGRVSELRFPLQIGRKNVCVWNIPVEELSVSGLHAELDIRRGRELLIRDLGSRNGVFVMGERVSESRLVAGTQVTIGQCRLVVESFRDDGDGGKLKYHRFEQRTGPGAGKFWDLRNTVTEIGSGVADGILCADLLVSKRHAEVTHKADDTCWIRDLGSRNGTRVNGVLLKDAERMLRNGDVVSVADIEFKFCDRAVPPPESVMRKVFVALATLSVCGSCYFAYQWVFPSAKALLRQAQAFEVRGDFARARSILEQALTARGSDEYRDEIGRKQGDLVRWEDTLGKWKSVCDAFSKRRWVSASKELGLLLDPSIDRWGWNADSALVLKGRARVLYGAVQPFLEARNALGGDFPDAAKGHERDWLAGQIEKMEAALANAEWTDEIPSGELRADMAEQCVAMRAIVRDLDDVDQLLARVRPGAPDAPLRETIQLSSGFADIVAALDSKVMSATEREKKREGEAEAVGRRFVTSPIVRDHCERFLPPLRKFADCRLVLGRNVERLAALKFDELEGEIPLPTDQQCSVHPAFGEIRRAMERANARVCGDFGMSIRDQVARLGRWGLDKGDLPDCVATLLDENATSAAFACDTLSGPYCRNDRTARSGRYDELLGVEEFADFLSDILGERTYPESAPDRPEPVLSVAIRFFRQASAFLRYVAQEDPAYIASLASPGGNGLKAVADKVSSLEEKKALLVDLWWNEEGDDRRRRVVSKGAALALDAGRQFGEDEAKVVKRELDAMRDAIRTLERKLQDDPESVSTLRPAMLETGLPRLMGLSRHWEQERKIGGAQ